MVYDYTNIIHVEYFSYVQKLYNFINNNITSSATEHFFLPNSFIYCSTSLSDWINLRLASWIYFFTFYTPLNLLAYNWKIKYFTDGICSDKSIVSNIREKLSRHATSTKEPLREYIWSFIYQPSIIAILHSVISVFSYTLFYISDSSISLPFIFSLLKIYSN